jgi:hypothetical protein
MPGHDGHYPMEEPTSLAIFGELVDEGGHRLERGELHVPEQRGDPVGGAPI